MKFLFLANPNIFLVNAMVADTRVGAGWVWFGPGLQSVERLVSSDGAIAVQIEIPDFMQEVDQVASICFPDELVEFYLHTP